MSNYFIRWHKLKRRTNMLYHKILILTIKIKIRGLQIGESPTNQQYILASRALPLTARLLWRLYLYSITLLMWWLIILFKWHFIIKLDPHFTQNCLKLPRPMLQLKVIYLIIIIFFNEKNRRSRFGIIPITGNSF